MGFRFFRRMKIAPGVSVNLSKSGPSLSMGPRGAKVTVGGSRGTRKTVGLPGTGLYYTTTGGGERSGRRRRASRDDEPAEAEEVPPERRLTLGFFQRLFTSAGEAAFVDGCRELVLGDDGTALEHFREGRDLPDAAFLGGFLCLRHDRLDEAEALFRSALSGRKRLGTLFDKYGIVPTMRFSVTPEVTAHAEPDARSILLALAEIHQERDDWKAAGEALRELRRIAPEDPVARLSLADILLDAEPDRKKSLVRVVKLCGEVENESPIHAALMLCKGRALRRLGLLDGARDVLTAACRKKKDRDPELLRAVRYERAVVYEASGRKSRARSEFEKIFAEDPDYEDVAERLEMV